MGRRPAETPEPIDRNGKAMHTFVEITDFHAPELDIYARLTETQLRSSHGIENSLFIAESPHVIERALDAGCAGIAAHAAEDAGRPRKGTGNPCPLR